MTSMRTAEERADVRARNAARRERQARRDAERMPIGELWRRAGGGTSAFSQRAFSELASSENWAAADRCTIADCGTAAPHTCWWSAIRASVLELRRRRPSARPPAGTTLF